MGIKCKHLNKRTEEFRHCIYDNHITDAYSETRYREICDDCGKEIGVYRMRTTTKREYIKNKKR